MTKGKDKDGDDDRPKVPAPRANPAFWGHDAAERTLRLSFDSGRLPHAWLIGGRRGIGKATLAYRFARFVLSGGMADTSAPAGEGPLYLAPGHPVFRRVDSGGHGDLLTVERGINPRTERRRTEIVVEDTRRVADFLHLTPSEGGWRVVVIDCAEDMNHHAANSVLKILEEPPPRALLLLVSHAPHLVLPTIRSRCRKLTLSPLDEAEIARVLTEFGPADLPPAEAAALARLADGSAGRALMLAEIGGLALYREFVDTIAPLPRLDLRKVEALGDRLGKADAGDLYRTFGEIVLWWLARLLRAGAGLAPGEEIVAGDGELIARLAAGPRASLDRWLELWDKVSRLFAQVERANLDRKQVLLTVFLDLEAAARA